jgi:glycine/D-amino acid oxidase-like deaminating enzyme
MGVTSFHCVSKLRFPPNGGACLPNAWGIASRPAVIPYTLHRHCAIPSTIRRQSLDMSSTVILGTGIIGASTAYYLAGYQPGSTIHLVEAAPELFSSASGYAGGFLAKDWYGPSVASLGALSFDEHRLLAKDHDGPGKWGYATSTALSYSVADKARARTRGEDWLRSDTSRAEVAVAAVEERLGETPGWLRRWSGDQAELISTKATTAQV